LEAELTKPVAWMRERLSGQPLEWLTYPYGFATSAVAAAAQAVGYKAALMVSGGWIQRPVKDPYFLPRLNVPAGLTARGFRLRLAGLIGTVVAPALQTGAGHGSITM
jgi:hypothetical protein